ncbi:alpha/beta hydrolase [Cesiribacter sp. SM1]|uniref:alpha/beta hydrolase n=1 Tax=Cesiribacter sp. SM1 TaxID=2861196 RepID=UPI001CD774D0|nr:hypothetical protein [Cesiribacter sp. SM1]
MEYQPLKYIYLPTHMPEAHTLLLLHAAGGDECSLLPLANEFGQRLNVLSVRGNVLEGDMYRFYRSMGMGMFDEKDLEFRTHELVYFLKNLSNKEAFDVEKIIALGYSNGANIAGGILMLYPDFLSGAILLRPMQTMLEKLDFKSSRQQPVFFSSGEEDSTVDSQATDRYGQLLTVNGFLVSRLNLQVGYQLTGHDIKLAVKWYQSRFDRVFKI